MPSVDPWDAALAKHFAHPMRSLARDISDFFSGTSVETHWDSSENYLTLELPVGASGETRSLSFWEPEALKRASALKEQLSALWFIDGYDATWLRSGDLIEARLRPALPQTGASLRRLFRTDEPIELRAQEGGTVRLGPPSPLFQVWGFGRTTLQLSGFNVVDTSHAKRLLESVGNALLFDIDLKTNAALLLAPDRTRRVMRRFRRDPSDLAFPTNQYDLDAVSLYWVAKTARDMTQLEFLSYYQVVEFYFPRYTQEAAIRAVAGIVRDPAFSSHRNDQLLRVVNALSSRRAFPRATDERTQMRTTLDACVNQDELFRFIKERPHLIEHLKTKNSRLSDINPRFGTSDFYEKLCERLYDIRCRIVHSKEDAGGGQAMIAPHSPEARLISGDSQIMEYLAQRVLIHSAQSLTFL